jgi:L-threonylcarbamoyladenylate synthase
LKTQRIVLTEENFDEVIARAAQIIRAGGLVAFPTETVYGLGANALDAQATARIFEAKQRALSDPLIVHIASTEALPDLTEGGWRAAAPLIEAFWPGPLTLVLPRGHRIPRIVTAGGEKVAIRMPNHPVALALIKAAGVPIAAPSANLFGHVSPTTAQHVLDDLDGRIDLVLDGGSTTIGVESTVLDVTTNPPQILRPGGVTREAIAETLAIGYWLLDSMRPLPIANSQSASSPGMLEKHYAPNAKLIIIKDTSELKSLLVQSKIQNPKSKIGLLLMAHEQAAFPGHTPSFVMGADLSSAAQNLYAGLRALDGAGAQIILVTQVEPVGIGEAIADRLRRAAAK